MGHMRKTFGEAKSLAGTLADNDGIAWGIWSTPGGDYLLLNAHNYLFKTAKRFGDEDLVAVVYPGNSNEDIFRRALEQIAYNENWPGRGPQEPAGDYWHRVRGWMQSIAANALTNAREI